MNMSYDFAEISLPTVFLSWAQTHRTWSVERTAVWERTVVSFAQLLRQCGVDVVADFFASAERGVDWTRGIAPIPALPVGLVADVLLPGETAADVPHDLRRIPRYPVSSLTADGMESLLRFLHARPKYPKAELGCFRVRLAGGRYDCRSVET